MFDKYAFYHKARDVPVEAELNKLMTQFGDDLDGAVEFYLEAQRNSKAKQSAAKENEDAEANPNEDADGRRTVCYRDQIWDKATRRWIYKRPSKSAAPTKKFARYVLVIRRVYTERMVFSHTEAEVRGKFLRDALRNIFRGTEKFPLTDKETELKSDEALRFLYWAKPELSLLEQHYNQTNNAPALFEIKAGLQFIHEEWSHTSSILESMLPRAISFEYLWTVIPPDSLVISNDILGQIRVYRVRAVYLSRRQDGSRVLILSSEYVDFNDKIGLVKTTLNIGEYTGLMDMKDLSVCPFRYHPDKDSIRQKVLDRTRRQLKFFSAGFKVQDHAGVGLVVSRQAKADVRKFHFRGRVVIDLEMMAQIEPNNPLIPELASLRREKRVWKSELTEDEHIPGIETQLAESLDTILPTQKGRAAEGSEPESEHGGDGPLSPNHLQEDHLLMFSGLVYGFSLGDGIWSALRVDDVKEVSWSTSVLSALVMDDNLKGMIFRLIETHAKGLSDFDDFIAGKGKGLIGLLSGPPGAGKTLTAEAVAETAKMPLYMVSSGALGANAADIHKNLTRILHLANHWKAVLLLDEADVFLAERSLADLERNAIVSVFLRELEYYPGILLLTTNQPRVIDPAFMSRIHFFHHYPSLDFKARKKIWQTFLDKMSKSKVLEVNVDDASMDMLASMEMNGRQIKNTASITSTLAMADLNKTITAEGIMAAAHALRPPPEVMKQHAEQEIVSIDQIKPQPELQLKLQASVQTGMQTEASEQSNPVTDSQKKEKRGSDLVGGSRPAKRRRGV